MADKSRLVCRMFKKAVQRGRSIKRHRAIVVFSRKEATTKLGERHVSACQGRVGVMSDFFNILLGSDERQIGADRIIAPALHGNPGRFPYIPLAG